MVLNFACSLFNPSIGTSIVFFNWYQVLNLFPRSSIVFESQLVLSIFLLLLNWWRSILRFVSNSLLSPFFFHLDDCIVNKGERSLHKDGLQEGTRGKGFWWCCRFSCCQHTFALRTSFAFQTISLCRFCCQYTHQGGD